ncbi:S53 family peptidase [Kitasatospora sp. RB6PN24]|uniref:S53 family peptidase n=1 Tax=Kitasatospora humi TaxID=2893891 RepID=UPI001E297CDC|nr:S53 family peptidase [Kitasatospora humi]MCC9309871.1 S53 family peptidase [Kitasatospora humi]
MSQSHYVALPDSDRMPRRGAVVAGLVNPGELLSVTVYLRRDSAAPAMPDPAEYALAPPTLRDAPDEAELTAANRAAPEDVEKVERFAARHGLSVAATNPLARSIRLTGTAAQMSEAFQVTLARYTYQDRDQRQRSYRGRQGAVHVPAELHGIVTAVLGLDNRPLGAHLLTRQVSRSPLAQQGDAAFAKLPPGAFLPNALAAPYTYPSALDGTGQTIAVLAFNGQTQPGVPSGGYRLSALQTYFTQVLKAPVPLITDVRVHGPGNDPGRDDGQGDPADSTGEIMLDLQVVGALAPGASIVVYFTEFTEQGWVDAMNAIVTDTVNRPSIISCSYGNPEDDPGSAWTRMAIATVDQAFAQAALRNISICCASGDDGSRDQGSDNRAHADFPASSPHVLGVGGTRLVADGARVVSETVWDDGPGSATGGGVSRWFPVPTWQASVPVPPSANPPHHKGRAVPDVSAVADPQTGVVIISVDGQHLIQIGGTSAAAPQWAALLARINQGLGAPVGFLNPLLYGKLANGVLRDITQGGNGAYSSGPGWDACTGFGSPGGQALLNGLKALGATQAHVPAPTAPSSGKVSTA